MAVTTFLSGSKTATIGTEHDLADVNVAGTYVFEVDAVNMAAGDVLELRVYSEILSSGTKRVVYFHQFYGAQIADDMIKVSLPIGNDLTDATSLSFTLKQTFGTGRVYPWKVLQFN